MKVVGLISGTSADAVDAAVLEVVESAAAGERMGDDGELPETSLLAYREFPFDPEVRDRILRAAGGRSDTRELTILRRDLGECFGRAARDLVQEAGLDAREIAAVGCHGQTVWHEPPAGTDDRNGTSLQLGDPAVVAAVCRVPVVSDFRSADLAAGGQGAPLVPWPDQVFFARDGEAVALQNLGGMGNVTWLPPRGAGGDPLAFDTGPGNVLLDLAATWASAGAESFDRGGALAGEGQTDPRLLARLLEHPFFRQPPPRSTGREVFGPPLVEELARESGLEPGTGGAWADLLATLTSLTVESVRRAYRDWVLPRGVDRVILTGGGAHNPALVEGLRAALHPLPVETGAEALGMDPDAREAAAFALLAWAFLRRRPGNVPSCTGASGPRVLGSWTPAPARADRGVAG